MRLNRKLIAWSAMLGISASAFSPISPTASASDLPVKAVAVPAAQQDGSPWTFMFTPYLWAASLRGDAALNAALPPVHVDADFSDVLKHLNMTFMGTFEVRNGKVGFIADVQYLAEKVSATGPLGFSNASLNDKTFFVTGLGSYRVFDQGNAWLDVLGGTRVWWRSDQLNISLGLAALSGSKDQSWVDAIFGLRARAYLQPKVYLELYGDAGGGGAKSDWQAMGTIGYQYNSTTSLFAGYRYLSIDYNKNDYLFDMKLSGPIFGATFRF